MIIHLNTTIRGLADPLNRLKLKYINRTHKITAPILKNFRISAVTSPYKLMHKHIGWLILCLYKVRYVYLLT